MPKLTVTVTVEIEHDNGDYSKTSRRREVTASEPIYISTYAENLGANLNKEVSVALTDRYGDARDSA